MSIYLEEKAKKKASYSKFIITNKAFTLVELIITIVILGIIGVVVIPKITITGFQDDADVMQFISNIRYIQHKSMVSGGGWKVIFDVANNKYTIYNKNGNIANLPDNKNPINVKSGLNQVVDEDGNNITEIYFDYWGRPMDSSKNLFTKKITVSISSYSIIIEPYAGGIYVQ